MKKFNSSKNIIIAIILVIIVVFLVSYSSMKRDETKEVGVVQSVTNDLTATLDNILSFPMRAVEGSVQSISNLFNTYEENDRLKKRLDEYAAIESQNKTYEKENKELKEQLNLTETLSSYDTISGSVITRSPDTWQDILIINKGKRDGVEAEMPVLGSKGLIGRVILSNETSAKVELLTSTNQNSNHFPVMVSPKEGESIYGLMEKYDDEEEAFIVSQLTSLTNIKVGDLVSTSGLGGGSPKGLVVGKVKKIKETSFGLDKEVYVTPVSSMYDISVVTVVKRLLGSDE